MKFSFFWHRKNSEPPGRISAEDFHKKNTPERWQSKAFRTNNDEYKTVAIPLRVFSFYGLNFEMEGWLNTQHPNGPEESHHAYIVIEPNDLFYNGTSPNYDRTPETHPESVDPKKIQHAYTVLKALQRHLSEQGYDCQIQKETTEGEKPITTYLLDIDVNPEKAGESFAAIQNILCEIETSYVKEIEGQAKGILGPIPVNEFTPRYNSWELRITSEEDEKITKIRYLIKEVFGFSIGDRQYDSFEIILKELFSNKEKRMTDAIMRKVEAVLKITPEDPKYSISKRDINLLLNDKSR